MSETWRIIADFPDYAVNDQGVIRRIEADKYGRNCGRRLNPYAGNHGYFVVTLHRGGKQSARLLHRLVCEAFHGPCPGDDFHAAHCDGNKLNNTAANLRWATVSENNRDKLFHGTIRSGDRHHSKLRPETVVRGTSHGNAKLNDEVVMRIRSDERPQREIAADIGISQSLVSLVKNRRIWAHIQ